jgi:hypothetical protein
MPGPVYLSGDCSCAGSAMERSVPTSRVFISHAVGAFESTFNG